MTYTLTNPQRPEEWDIYADWLTEDGIASWGLEPTDVCECGHLAGCHGAFGRKADGCKAPRDVVTCHAFRPLLARDLPPHTHAPCEARLTAWLLRMGDEAWHGMEATKRRDKRLERVMIQEIFDGCQQCRNMGPDGYGCNECLSKASGVMDHPPTLPGKGRPTFALLFDHDGAGKCERCAGGGRIHDSSWIRDEPCKDCHGTGRERVRGHWGELVDWMKAMGDPRADGLDARIISREEFNAEHGPSVAATPFWVQYKSKHDGKWHGGEAGGTYADACREALKRLREKLTEPCVGTRHNEMGNCQQCMGLGWVIRRVHAQ